MDIELLERKIENHRNEMLRYCYRAVLVETDPEKIEKAKRRAKGHQVELNKLLQKKKRLLSLLKT